MTKLRTLDLFSGIGGFSLGLERTGGFETVAFCEIDPFCRRVLAKHWPKVRQYEDVRELTAERLRADGISVDVICGGFPCQDISVAGKGVGIDGERSGLWSEYARLAGELRPSFIIVENVAALLGRGLDRVLGDLAALGFDAEWHCIPAAAVGAPHRRDRVWTVAHANGGRFGRSLAANEIDRPIISRDGSTCADAGTGRRSGKLADADREREQQSEGVISQERGRFGDGGHEVAYSERRRLQGGHVERAEPQAIIPAAYGRHSGGREFGSPWWIEPDVGRVAHGVPSQVDRLRSLGNAVVPQIPELIGNAILASFQAERGAA